MKKLALDIPTMLQGMGSWALPGAAIGAAGMGAANLLAPESNDPLHKKRSLLKSMLLGGLLGGGIGAGGRAIADTNPEIANNPGTALNQLFNKTPVQEGKPNLLGSALSMTQWPNVLVPSAVAGIGGAGIAKSLSKGWEMNTLKGENVSKTTKFLNAHAGKLGGVLALSTLLAGILAKPKLEQAENYNMHNTPQGLANIHAQAVINGGQP